MDARKLATIGLIPIVGGVILLGALLIRQRSREAPAPSEPKIAKVRVEQRPGPETPLVTAQPPARPALASEKTVAARSEEVRIRSTFQNYRTAVATRNASLEQSLRPVLLKDRETCVALAQDELTRAQTDFDRDVARKVLEAMRR